MLGDLTFPVSKFQLRVSAAPCPCCGAGPEIRSGWRSNGAGMEFVGSVVCPKCDLQVVAPALPNPSDYQMRLLQVLSELVVTAVGKWNMRVSSQPGDDEDRELETACDTLDAKTGGM